MAKKKTNNHVLVQLDAWHQTTPGLLTFAVIELVLAYVFVSLAIDSGLIWQWVITIVLCIGAVVNLLRFAGALVKR